LYTTFDGFKALRLVCRRFNVIVKPRVYHSSHIKVFRKYHDLSSNVDQLLTLLSSEPNEQLHATTTLHIGNCDWLEKKVFVYPFYRVSAIKFIFYHLVSLIVERRQRAVKTNLRASAKLRLCLPISQFNLPNVSHVVYVVCFTIPEQTPNVS